MGRIRYREPDRGRHRWCHEEDGRGHPPLILWRYLTGYAMTAGENAPLMYGPAITAKRAKKMASVTPVVTLLASSSLILPFPAPLRNVSNACPPSMG